MKELFNNTDEFWSEKELKNINRKSLINKLKQLLTKLYNTDRI